MVWRNNTTGAWGYSDISGGSNVFHSLGNSNTAYSVAAVADFNGDGKAGILWQNLATGSVGYSVGNGGTGPMAFQVLGTAPPHFAAVS